MSNLDLAAEHMTRASHAPNHAQAQQHFEAGWIIALPTIEIVTRSETKNRLLAEDATQRTALKLWSYTQRAQRTVGAGLIRTVAQTSSWDVLNKQAPHDDHATELHDIHHAPDDDPDIPILWEQLARIAENLPYAKPLWADILRCIPIMGDNREDIARHLGRPASTIRGALMDIRESDLFNHITNHPPTTYQTLFRLQRHHNDAA